MTKNEYLMVGRGRAGKMLFRTFFVHHLANLLGLQVHIGGWPYGASRSRALNRIAEGAAIDENTVMDLG